MDTLCPQSRGLSAETNISPSMASFNLFFTGRDDPRHCMLIGEDTTPRFFCFETERHVHGARTTVISSNNQVASLFFGPSNRLESVTIGNRAQVPLELLSPGSSPNARSFFSADGRKFEWRKNGNDAYDLYALNPPIVRIAAFRRYSEETPVGRCTGLLQYTFAQDGLLLYSLVTLCLNRWVDTVF
ncbi:hypothetical protein GGX14DRAFT_18632 [Mycena pura]|uniref:DUF6593 domain-containing protein n=1 Tax=Mycena pura TaxID=153505 RepID=A0AAD6VQG2_9AGAR|nr:hypothetical protein GGX14DRAFT_18632 [Mycena pura]